jgi:hypothetical protein
VIYALLESLALFQLVDYRIVFGTASREQRANPLNRLDKELIYVHRPYLHLKGVMPAGDIGTLFEIGEVEPHAYDLRTDRDGFRNPTDLEQADIVVIGDSYIEGLIVPQEKLVSSDLSRLLGRTVLNLGQAGYGPQQEFNAFKRYGIPRKPRLCIWFFFEENDLSDATQYVDLINRWDYWTGIHHSFAERSFAQNLKYFFWPRIEPKARLDGNYGILPNGRKTYFFPQSDVLMARDRMGLQILENELTKFGQLLDDHDISLLMVYIPTKSRVYRDVCTYPALLCNKWFVDLLPRRLEQMLANTVPTATFLDLTEPMHQAALKGTRVYFEDDSHWTVEGHLIAAEEIARVIREKKLLGDLPPKLTPQAAEGSSVP